MARGINKVILVGNLRNDPETRYLPSGGAVTNFSIATSSKWKDKNTGQEQEKTEWHRCVAFNRLGEIAGQYLKKGSKVYVEGSLRTNQWDDKDGNKRYTTEIIVGELQMLDKLNTAQSQGQQGFTSVDERATTMNGGDDVDSFNDGIPWDDDNF